MRNRTAILIGVAGLLAANFALPAQAASCATVVECANQMVGIATDLKAQNAQLVTKNNELQARVQALENQVRDQTRRTNDADTALRNDLNRVSTKPLPRNQGQCQRVDGASNGQDLWCPVGFYVAGAKNTDGHNDMLDMIWCCPSN